MNAYPYEVMIQRDIDGTLSSEEQSILAQYLTKHPDARLLQEQLSSVHGALSGEPWVEPPATLRANVMRSIQQPSSSSVRRPATWTSAFQPIADLFRGRPVLTFGFGIAAGIIALLPLAGRFVEPGLVPESQVSATMFSAQSWQTGTQVDEFVFAEGDIVGSVRLGVVDSRLVVTTSVTSSEFVEIEFGYELRQLSLAGFLSQGSDQVNIVAQNGALMATHSGHAEYQLAFNRPSLDISTLTLTISSDDRPVVSGSLKIGPE